MGTLLEELKTATAEERKKEELEIVKKYHGRGGWRGGGRPRKADEDKTPYKTISIAGSPAEIAEIRKRASESGKTISRFIIDLVLYDI